MTSVEDAAQVKSVIRNDNTASRSMEGANVRSGVYGLIKHQSCTCAADREQMLGGNGETCSSAARVLRTCTPAVVEIPTPRLIDLTMPLM